MMVIFEDICCGNFILKEELVVQLEILPRTYLETLIPLTQGFRTAGTVTPTTTR